jgi:hypothetical protein
MIMYRIISRRHGVLILVLVLVLVVSSTVGWAQTPPKPSSGCAQVHISEPQPLWISSATFVDSLGKVAIVDSLRSDILLIDPRAGRAQSFKKNLVTPAKEMVPAFLNRTDSGFVLSMVDQRLFWLDKRLNRVGTGDLIKSSAGSHGTIVSAYQSVVSGGDLLAFGAVKTNVGKFRFGFFRVPLKMSSSFEFLRDFDEVDYYLLGHKYLTGLDDQEYVVLMNDKAVISQFLPGGNERVLNLIPEPYRQIPKLQTDTSAPNSEEALFKEIEGLKIPVGLYGQNGLLYLLTREPKGDGGTLWQLFPIRPGLLEVLDPIQLPTTAHHLTIVNTAHDWYIFEKGAVQAAAKQSINSMLVIPNALIESHAVPKTCRIVN